MSKIRFMVVGLPRSGTTIVSNYINAAHSAFCFIEPHWEYVRTCRTDFFRDRKLGWSWFLRYHPEASLPLDAAVTRILKRYDLVGFKETFRSDVYEEYGGELCNQALLSAYRDHGYRLIPVVRNPLAIWNSFLSNGAKKGAWGGDLDCLMQNYLDFFVFSEGTVPIVYEHFVDSPERAFAELGIDLGEIGALEARALKTGDRDSNRSTAVSRREKPTYYSNRDRERIERSEAMERYRALRPREELTGRKVGSGV